MRLVSKFKKQILVAGLTAAVALGASSVFAQKEGKAHKGDMKEPKAVTLVGEVLDMYCYMKHPADGQGPDHAKCAKTCINKGLPIGFLADGKVYLIIGKDHESAKDLVVDFAGRQGKLTGTLVDHHGVMAIEVDKIEEVSKKSEG